MTARNIRAVILCAGRGGRLRPLTDDRPKCLLQVGDRTILERSLENLAACGVSETILVTGYRSAMVEDFARKHGRGPVRFIRNPEYARTNTAVSLHLALREIDDDVILINGDVLYDPVFLSELLALPEPGGVVVDTDISLNSEEVKIFAANGRLTRIGKDLDPALSLGEAIGLNKIGRDFIPGLIRVYEDLERRGERGHYFEIGFDRLSAGPDRPAFGLVFTRGRPWVEIDTPEDFSYAELHVAPRLLS